MPRKRRSRPEPDDVASPSNEEAAADGVRPTRRRAEEDEDQESVASDEGVGIRTPSNIDVMVKKLVRLALASEYSRLPIRRADISAKVLGEQGSRQFKSVFDQAQNVLKVRFGMELTELPGREKITITQRRAAQRIEKPSTASKSWSLTSTLPEAYRIPKILPPTKAPSSSHESTYVALYTFLVTIITLSGGAIPEQRLDRYLKRTNADSYTPIERTDRLLQRLCKDGYLVRNREIDGGEEIVEYMVGPRGKIEVGEAGVAGLVREVYGRTDPDEDAPGQNEEADDFEKRLERSLVAGRREKPRAGPDQGGDGHEPGRADAQGTTKKNQTNRRRRRPSDGDDSDD
ncbi:MAGE family domain containing protein [Elaphomyces granulatus]